MIILEGKPGHITVINPEYIKFIDTVKFEDENKKTKYRVQFLFNGEKEFLQLDMDPEIYNAFVTQVLTSIANTAQVGIAEIIGRIDGQGS